MSKNDFMGAKVFTIPQKKMVNGKQVKNKLGGLRGVHGFRNFQDSTLSVSVFPNPKNTRVIKSRNGQQYMRGIATVKLLRSGMVISISVEPVLINQTDGQVVLKNHQILIRPATGYCGTLQRYRK